MGKMITITRNDRYYPAVCCRKCGLKAGTQVTGTSTMHKSTCLVCGENSEITETRDFGYPPFKITKQIHFSFMCSALLTHELLRYFGFTFHWEYRPMPNDGTSYVCLVHDPFTKASYCVQGYELADCITSSILKARFLVYNQGLKKVYNKVLGVYNEWKASQKDTKASVAGRVVQEKGVLRNPLRKAGKRSLKRVGKNK